MNMKRFWITVAVVITVILAYWPLVTRLFLASMYKPYTPGAGSVWWAPKLFLQPWGVVRYHPWLYRLSWYVSGIIFALAFTYIFSRGVEGKGWLGEGFRYGVLAWGLAYVPTYVGMYGWSQFPGRILFWWIIFSLIQCVILGWICAALYKKELAVP